MDIRNTKLSPYFRVTVLCQATHAWPSAVQIHNAEKIVHLGSMHKKPDLIHMTVDNT